VHIQGHTAHILLFTPPSDRKLRLTQRVKLGLIRFRQRLPRLQFERVVWTKLASECDRIGQR